MIILETRSGKGTHPEIKQIKRENYPEKHVIFILNSIVMKTLFLVRHAKSDKDNSNLYDYDRPLNERGYKDARALSVKIKKSVAVPHLIVSSPAVRAVSTALIFADSFDYDPANIILNKNLYESSEKEYMKAITSFDHSSDSVMIFGHNPTMTMLANRLSKPFTENLPTCGITGIEFDINSWKDLKAGAGKLILYDFPKNPAG
jgi:phosphohistidine phosphatase